MLKPKVNYTGGTFLLWNDRRKYYGWMVKIVGVIAPPVITGDTDTPADGDVPEGTVEGVTTEGEMDVGGTIPSDGDETPAEGEGEGTGAPVGG